MRRTAAFLLCGCLAAAAAAGVNEEVDFVLRNHALTRAGTGPDSAPFAAEPGVSRPIPRVASEPELIWGLALGIYRRFLSPQSRPDVCTFVPSCSCFAVEAARRYGLALGLLMTADRLQRCHPYNRAYYPPDHATGLRSDPPERNVVRRGAK